MTNFLKEVRDIAESNDGNECDINGQTGTIGNFDRVLRTVGRLTLKLTQVVQRKIKLLRGVNPLLRISKSCQL